MKYKLMQKKMENLKIAQHLVIWPKSTQNMKGIPQIHWPTSWLVDSQTEQVVVVFLMNLKWNFKHLK